MATDKAEEVLEAVIKDPDNLFPTFSKEMMAKMKEELLKAFDEAQKKKGC